MNWDTPSIVSANMRKVQPKDASSVTAKYELMAQHSTYTPKACVVMSEDGF